MVFDWNRDHVIYRDQVICTFWWHYSHKNAMASQITGNSAMCSTTCSGWQKENIKGHYDIDGLVQERRNSSVITMDLCLSCISQCIRCVSSWSRPCCSHHPSGGLRWRRTVLGATPQRPTPLASPTPSPLPSTLPGTWERAYLLRTIRALTTGFATKKTSRPYITQRNSSLTSDQGKVPWWRHWLLWKKWITLV